MAILGYNTAGTTRYNGTSYKGVSNYNVLAPENGVITGIYIWSDADNNGKKCKLGIYEGTNSALQITDSRVYGSQELTASGVNYWAGFNDLNISMVSGRYYRMCFANSDGANPWYLHYDGDGSHYYNLSTTYSDEITDQHGSIANTGSIRMSLYIEYTPSGATGKPYYYFRNQ